MSSLDERHKFILEEIEKSGSVSVLKLAKTLDVSEMTIRRDLNELEKIGLVRRIHGGAVNPRGRGYEPPLSLRSLENKKVKERIGRYAADFVAEGDSIAFDIGSTIYEIAAQLKEKRNITIITPSIPIASLFFDSYDIRLILPGGIVRPGEKSLIGDIAQRILKDLFVDRLFLGVGAVDAKAGLTEYNVDDTSIKRIMIQNAKEVIAVADSSKFQKTAFTFISSFQSIHHFITNAKPPEDLMVALKEHEVNVHIVEEMETFVL